MKIASFKTLKKNRKSRLSYAIAAIERDMFSDDEETETEAVKAYRNLREGEMSKDEMLSWALREQEYKMLIC